jgi:peptidoglycan hydrolase CwlO-like protein
MSNKKPKGKLDAITFIYGFGAAVVLVGAMFKFLGWQFANELFIVGLSIEAVVFLISAFERQTADKEYHWENVFPQLNAEGGLTPDTGAYKDAMAQFSTTLTELSGQLKDVTGSLTQIKNELDATAQNSASMKAKMTEFSQLMETYNGNLKTINEKYNQVLGSK